MKSLVESLFDNNIKKDLTIRQVCELSTSPRGIAAAGVPMGYFFNIKKLKEYENPFVTNGSDVINCLIGIIADQPMPLLTGGMVWDKSNEWCANLKKILTKYTSRNWRYEWDKKVNIFLIKYNNGMFGVSIDYDSGSGSYEFIFKPIS